MNGNHGASQSNLFSRVCTISKHPSPRNSLSFVSGKDGHGGFVPMTGPELCGGSETWTRDTQDSKSLIPPCWSVKTMTNVNQCSSHQSEDADLLLMNRDARAQHFRTEFDKGKISCFEEILWASAYFDG